MPNISTVMPAGGGAFTTLQAWEDFADDQGTADQWAEWYSGGDAGGLTMAGWAATSSSTVYPRVYVADGHGHGGDVDSGAYTTGTINIDNAPNYTEIDGARLTSFAVVRSFGSGRTGHKVRNCLVVGGAGSAIAFRLVSDALIANNVIDGTSANGIVVERGTTFVANNTVYNASGTGILLSAFNAFIAGTLTAECYNNIVLNSGTADFGFQVDGDDDVITYTGDYNIASDASLTAAGENGANDLESQSATAVLADPANDDFTLAASSPALNSGVDLTAQGITTDCRGVSRPQGEGWDRGAFEMEAGGSGGEGPGGSGEGSQPGSGSGGSAGSSGSDGSGGSGGSLPSLTGRPRFVSPSTMNPFKPHKSPFQR